MEQIWTQELQFLGQSGAMWATGALGSVQCTMGNRTLVSTAGQAQVALMILMSLGQRRDILILEAFPQAQRQGHGLSVQLP